MLYIDVCVGNNDMISIFESILMAIAYLLAIHLAMAWLEWDRVLRINTNCVSEIRSGIDIPSTKFHWQGEMSIATNDNWAIELYSRNFFFTFWTDHTLFIARSFVLPLPIASRLTNYHHIGFIRWATRELILTQKKRNNNRN